MGFWSRLFGSRAQRDDSATRQLHSMLEATPDLAEALRQRHESGNIDKTEFIQLLEQHARPEGMSHAEHKAVVLKLMAMEREPGFWSIAAEVIQDHPDPRVKAACAEEIYNRVMDRYLLDKMTFEDRKEAAAAILTKALAKAGASERAALEIALHQVQNAKDPWEE